MVNLKEELEKLHDTISEVALLKKEVDLKDVRARLGVLIDQMQKCEQVVIQGECIEISFKSRIEFERKIKELTECLNEGIIFLKAVTQEPMSKEAKAVLIKWESALETLK